MSVQLTCQICGKKLNALTSHLKKHNITCGEYKVKYNSPVLIPSLEVRRKISSKLKNYYADKCNRLKNSISQKNGGSIFTTKYWTNKGYSDEDAKQKISEIQKKNSEKSWVKSDRQSRSFLCKKYWINKGKSDDEASEIIKKHQKRASSKSPRFNKHKHFTKTKLVISSNMRKKIKEIGVEKWISHFGKFDGTSKVEVECYNYIRENIDNSIRSNITINGYIVDYIKDKKIIEFYGDYWHANPKIYKSSDFVRNDMGLPLTAKDIWDRDGKRCSILQNMGYTLMVVWESEWKFDRELCIKKIREYLK